MYLAHGLPTWRRKGSPGRRRLQIFSTLWKDWELKIRSSCRDSELSCPHNGAGKSRVILTVSLPRVCWSNREGTPVSLVSIQRWPFSAISVSICGIPCAAYNLYASAQSLDFLDLAENCSFLNWKLKLLPILANFNFWMGTTLSGAAALFKIAWQFYCRYQTLDG